MRIVIPHTTRLRPEVRALGENLGAIFEDVSDSEMAYGELVAKLWAKGESFMLCEHDVLAEPRLLEEMAACPEPWCAGFAWRYSGDVMPGKTRPQHPIREKEFALFLNKFNASLLARTPAVVGAVRVRWTQVDLALWGGFSPAEAKPHLHEPAVRPPAPAAPSLDDGNE